MRPDQPRPARPAPPDIAELRALRTAHPELAPAIDLQIELVESAAPPAGARADARRAADGIGGRRASLGRTTAARAARRSRSIGRTSASRSGRSADILRRHESLDADDHARIVALAREATTIDEADSRPGTTESSVPPGQREAGSARQNLPAALDQVLHTGHSAVSWHAPSTSPVKASSCEAWHQPWCPFCGAEAEFAILTAEGARLLTCGRCEGRWPWDEVGCTGARRAILRIS